MPSCGAARPTPIASFMIAAIRLTWLRSESSKRSTGVALLFSTGSPKRRMNDIAAARLASASGSRRGSSSVRPSSASPRGRSSAIPRESSPVPGAGRCDRLAAAAPGPRSPLVRRGRHGGPTLGRVDVDREAHAAAAMLGRRSLHCGTDLLDRPRPLTRLDDDLGARLPLPAEERRRTEGGHAGRGERVPDGANRGQLRAGLGGGADHPDEVAERRITEGLPARELAAQEALGVVARGVAQRAGLGIERLYDHPALPRSPAASTGELGDEREGALLGAKVREAYGRVGVEHE